ncbi:MAG: energy transducer TonB [Treponema sp.]|jgi:protein TonB|nr:energy transducer TonB [Treponema sp.]
MDTNRIRLAIFIVAGVLHAFLLFSVAFKLNTVVQDEESGARVMKLADIQEDIPLPPPLPPPPPPKPKAAAPQPTVAAVAENMIATDEVPPDQVVGEPEAAVYAVEPAAVEPVIDFLPQHKISVPPVLSDDKIRNNVEYPAIALRSGIEGTVILELFIDSRGEIRRINVLKEDPPERGFAEAAVNAFRDITAVPAEANGTAVAVRYRYPVRFKIKG